jgi:hypothetical protein
VAGFVGGFDFDLELPGGRLPVELHDRVVGPAPEPERTGGVTRIARIDADEKNARPSAKSVSTPLNDARLCSLVPKLHFGTRLRAQLHCAGRAMETQ